MNWIYKFILKKIMSDSVFKEFMKKSFIEFYKKDSLGIFRIWGDESRLIIGDNVVINDALINTVSGHVKIGDNSFFGHSVFILTGTHNVEGLNLKRQQDFPIEGRDIIIGSGVWIASNAIVLAPCTIGDNAVVSAGSVVTGTVEANSIYSGSKAIKKRSLF